MVNVADQGPQAEGELRISLCADVVGRRLDDEMVLVHMQTNRIYTLSSTAARFWELLQDGLGRGEILRRLAQEYEVGEAELDAEMAALVSRLLEARLILVP